MTRSLSPLHRAGLGLSVWLAALIAPVTGTAQQRDITQWRLTATPHGITYERSDLPKSFTVHRIDATGGDVEIRKWFARVPSIYQTVRYRWTFGTDVTRIRQGDRIPVELSVTVADQGGTPNWNPTVQLLGGNGGASGPSMYLGAMTPGARYLTWSDSRKVFAHKGAAHWSDDVPIGSGRAVLNVTDKTGIGADVDSEDGYFRIALSDEFDAVYLYEAEAPSGAPTGVRRGGAGWRLAGIPNGITFERSDVPKSYTVHRIDARGGDVEIRQWSARVPEIYQATRYRWSFPRDVTVICENDEIPVDLSVTVESQGGNPNWNPYIHLFGGNGGASGGSMYLGEVSPGARYLTWGDSRRVYARKGAAHWSDDIPIGESRAPLRVTDRTGIGADVDAPDGYFRISMSDVADAVYRYVEDPDAECGGSAGPGGGVASVQDADHRPEGEGVDDAVVGDAGPLLDDPALAWLDPPGPDETLIPFKSPDVPPGPTPLPPMYVEDGRDPGSGSRSAFGETADRIGGPAPPMESAGTREPSTITSLEVDFPVEAGGGDWAPADGDPCKDYLRLRWTYDGPGGIMHIYMSGFFDVSTGEVGHHYLTRAADRGYMPLPVPKVLPARIRVEMRETFDARSYLLDSAERSFDYDLPNLRFTGAITAKKEARRITKIQFLVQNGGGDFDGTARGTFTLFNANPENSRELKSWEYSNSHLPLNEVVTDTELAMGDQIHYEPDWDHYRAAVSPFVCHEYDWRDNVRLSGGAGK